MTKQEFMAMSLPYELVITDEELQEFPILTGIEYTTEQCLAIQGDSGESDIDSVMPILRPLSDLTKEIEHGRDKIIPVIDIFLKNVREIKGKYIIFKNGYSTTIGELKFNQVQKLIEWHFDIAGLIDKGEAIDINTLEENPYK